LKSSQARNRKSKEPTNKQNSILARLIHDTVPKSLSRRRSQKAENTNEYVHFKEFFGETGLLDDSERFQSFIEDLAQNGFADEMAKQINSKMTTASHNSSFQNYIVDDIISNALKTDSASVSAPSAPCPSTRA
jgi:hypothetical protein